MGTITKGARAADARPFRPTSCKTLKATAFLLTLTAALVVSRSILAADTADSAVKLPAWTDIRGNAYSAADVARGKAAVFIFISSQCPIANLYAPRINELERDFGARGVRLFAVDSNSEDSAASLLRYAREHGFTIPVVKDHGTLLADRLDASCTPEAVLLDRTGVVRYRGRIDDNVDRTKIVRHDLRDALAAVLAGRQVDRARMLPFGCKIFRELPQSHTATASVTYTRDVAPILDRACVTCHRQGEAAPFALQTFQQAHTWSVAIRDYTARRIMPPWHATPGYGDFRDTNTLSDAEIATLAAWTHSGAPEGDAKLRPTLPVFSPPGEWKLGTPDLVLRSSKPYHLGPEGADVYREFVLPLDLSEDRYLNAIEFRPDRRAVVHHMIAYFDPTGRASTLDGKESEPGYTVPGGGIGVFNAVFVTGWAPGNTPHILPTGAAFKLSKGGRLVLQVHYHRDGKMEADQSSIGIHFSKGPIEREMRVWAALNMRLDLKPGVADQHVNAAFRLPCDVHVWSSSPHMHMLGRQMKMTATLPNGSEIPMVWIKDWDFNWQESYDYREPLALPQGTMIHVEAVYDNTEGNPRQPTQPPKRVRWGEQTTDEMCIGFFTVTVDAEHLSVLARR